MEPLKLIRVGEPGHEKPGVIYQDRYLDVSSFGEDFTEAFLGSNGINRLRTWLQNQTNLLELKSGERLGPPITRPSKIICVGLNYRKHALESKMPAPVEPIIFFKSTTALCGPNDALVIPRNSIKTDYEVELAVVIGKVTKYVSEAEAESCIAGFCLHNDYSEREFQLERNGQWVKGKSCDTFAPLGPWLLPIEDVSDYQDLNLWLKVNGEMRQQESTADMIYHVPFLVSYISQFMTLLPGDVISTGTPSGVGLGMNPPLYIKEGDYIELGCDKLGTQHQTATKDHAN